MGRGRKIYRTGLLIMKSKFLFCAMLVIFMLTPLFFIHAQEETEEEEEEDPGPQITTSVSPETPVSGRPFSINLVIDYPVPEEVTIIPPPFGDSFILDRIIKTPRVTETQVFTVVEYRLIPLRSGRIALQSFTVVCPAGVRESDSFVLNVRGEGEQTLVVAPRLVWEAPRQMEVGDRVTLVLRANGWNSSEPPPDFFMPPVPQNVILASLPLSEEERDGGIAVKLNLIPLDAGNFRLGARTIRHENANARMIFSIPALSIQITGSSAVQAPPPDEDSTVDEAIVNAASPFPEFILTAPAKSGIRESHRLQCENIYNTAKDLWDSGLFAKSLACLRLSERDHPAGGLLQPIRRQAEENLGIFNTENENRQRRKLLSALYSFILFIVIIAPFVCLFFVKRRNRNSCVKIAFINISFRMNVVLIFAVVFSAALSVFFYRLSASNFVFHGKENRLGIAKETPVRRMADIEGEEIFSFREGQPVVILLYSSAWVYAKANDASAFSGWVPAEKIEFY